MRTIEQELRDLYPLDWQPSSMRPHGFELYTGAWSRGRNVTFTGARAGAVLVVKADSPPIRHYLVCVADAHGAGLVSSGPVLAEELRDAAKNHAGIRATLTAHPKADPFTHLAGLLADHGGVLSVERDEDGKLCVRVAFANDGVAFTQAGDGTLLGNVVEAVGCHVGVSPC
jgi:hypothetical protein